MTAPSERQMRAAEAPMWGGQPDRPRKLIVASDWRSVEKNSLKGFLTLRLPSGLVLRECSLHESHGKRWIGLPARPQIDADGMHRKDPSTGKGLYTPCVEVTGKEAREKFQRAALTAVERLLRMDGAS